MRLAQVPIVLRLLGTASPTAASKSSKRVDAAQQQSPRARAAGHELGLRPLRQRAGAAAVREVQGRAQRLARVSAAAGAARDDGARAPPHLLGCVALMGDGKRMQLRGLHHVTAISRDLERTIAFYRDLLGLAIVHDGPSDDDPQTRHVWFGALDGGPGQLLSFMQYPELPQGVVGIGSTHHFALVVGSPDEQEAWRDYLRGQGVECTDVFDRGAFRSIYLRDPDGHIVEIATSGPGFRAGGPSSVPPV